MQQAADAALSSMQLTFRFTEAEFLKACLHQIATQRGSLVDNILSVLEDFFAKPEGLTLTQFELRHLTPHWDTKQSLSEYIHFQKLTIGDIRLDLHSTPDTDLAVSRVLLPDFLHTDNDEYTNFRVKEFGLKTKSRTQVELFSLHLTNELLSKIFWALKDTDIALEPSKLGTYEWRQTFYHKITGQSYFCECFREAITKKGDERLLRDSPHLTQALEMQWFKRDICHLCTHTPSDLFFCSPMYGSEFKVRYGSYIRKFEIEQECSERDAENLAREAAGIAKIGEKWINETLLFNFITLLFADYQVLREASPPWLNKQRYDIYVPELKLAVEYHGIQHFKAVPLFGGEEGLKKTQARDKEKLAKSKANGITVVEFTCDDNLSETLIKKRLKPFLKP